MLSQKLNSVTPENEQTCPSINVEESWEQWIWEESIRRCDTNSQCLSYARIAADF